VGTLFLSAFLGGAGALALWIDARRPSLAPESLTQRVVAAACALLALQLIPVYHGSVLAVYATLFGLLLPVLVSSLLAAVWLLKAVGEARLR